MMSRDKKQPRSKVLKLPVELFEKLRRLAAESDFSLQELIRHLLENAQMPSTFSPEIAMIKGDKPPERTVVESGGSIEELESRLRELSLLIQTAPEQSKAGLADKYADVSVRLFELRRPASKS